MPRDTTLGTVRHTPTNGASDAYRVEPVTDLLREGFIVGVAPDGVQTVRDPRDSATADVEIQAAHDYLATNFGGSDVGKVWIPPTDPSGNVLEIASTMTFDGGDSSRFTTIVPCGWMHSIAGKALDITIDDGSPAFVVRDSINMEWGGIVGRGAVANNDATGSQNAADATLVKMENCQRHHVHNVHGRNLGKANAPAVFIIGSDTYNSTISHITSNMEGAASLPDSVFLRFDDTASTLNPGELFITGTSSYSDPDRPTDKAVVVQGGSDNIFLSGSRFEGTGANGNSMIEVGGGCQLFIGDDCQIGRLEDPTASGTVHHIETLGNGAEIYIPDTIGMGPNDTGGNHVTLAAGTKGYIGSFDGNATVGNNGGVDIEKTSNSPNRLVLPREESMVNSVNYAFTTWDGERYHDGWQEYRSGTDTIAANGVTQVNDASGGVGGPTIRVAEYYVDADPNATAYVFPGFGWDETIGTDGGTATAFYNPTSNSIDVTWRLERKTT